MGHAYHRIPEDPKGREHPGQQDRTRMVGGDWEQSSAVKEGASQTHQNQDCCPAIFNKMETINLWSFKLNTSLFPAILHSTSLYDVLQQSKTTQIC